MVDQENQMIQEDIRQAEETSLAQQNQQRYLITERVNLETQIGDIEREIDLFKQQIKEIAKRKRLATEQEELKSYLSSSFTNQTSSTETISQQLTNLEIKKIGLEEQLEDELRKQRKVQPSTQKITNSNQPKFHLIFLANLSSDTDTKQKLLLFSYVGPQNAYLQKTINSILLFQQNQRQHKGDIYSFITFDTTADIVMRACEMSQKFTFQKENHQGEKDLYIAFGKVLELIDKTGQQYIPILITFLHTKKGEVKFSNEAKALKMLKENNQRYNLITLGHNQDENPNFEALICAGNENAQGGLATLGNQKFFCYEAGNQTADFFESALQKISSHFKAQSQGQKTSTTNGITLASQRKIQQLQEELQHIEINERSLQIDLEQLNKRSVVNQQLELSRTNSNQRKNELLNKEIVELEGKIDEYREKQNILKKKLKEKTENMQYVDQERGFRAQQQHFGAILNGTNQDTLKNCQKLTALLQEYDKTTHPVKYLMNVMKSFEDYVNEVTIYATTMIHEPSTSTEQYVSSKRRLTDLQRILNSLAQVVENLKDGSQDASLLIY